jgi:hypothetical protein
MTYSSLNDAPTFDAFLRLDWREQRRVLDRLNDLSCAQGGRTYAEAQRKRAPIDALYVKFQRALDADIQEWVRQGYDGNTLTEDRQCHNGNMR